MPSEVYRFGDGPYIVEVKRRTGTDYYGFFDPSNAQICLDRYPKGQARMFVEEGAPSPFPDKARPPRKLLID